VTARSRTSRWAAAGLLTLAVAVAVAVAGCGDSAVKETNDGRIKVSGTGKHAQVTIESGNGASATYSGTRVPADFPAAVPRPALRLTSGAVDRAAGGERFLLTYVVPAEDAAATVLDAYRARLTDAGLTVDAPDATHLAASGDGWSVTANLVPRTTGTPGTLAVVVTRS
jgi:hypothetical protein